MALARLTVARLITPEEVLMENCLASTMCVGIKGKQAVGQHVGLGAGGSAYVWGCGMREGLDNVV